ncbi:MAG: sigma-54-dependent Fis family transcriptional regulator [Desulfuromonas sp.]|uniref:sigma-54 interaction domain-containing protein n=1 Tax=Desulfuromonas sp. TaxID=892 RepID=UPI000CC328A3|nr:sigma-54 dependent transcriptional regulator [Desulfuromonas sp.]PLX85618.1 MAG: sigma-54-dependent Fis family transcriptional regulator [Desulfuromonas sp.]
MSSEQNFQSGRLPVPSPDLVVAQAPGGDWLVVRVTPRLAKIAALSSDTGAGRPLGQLFPTAVPDLTSLAREAAEEGHSLVGVRVRLGGGAEESLAADVSPGGLTGDFRAQTVAFSFRSLSPGETGAVSEFHGLVGSGPGIREVFRKISLYASSDAAVVITGETGTGKELVARALHDTSPRGGGAYVAVNCAAISDELLESELFGHEKGAFTGALRTHRGRFERAHRGSLFLDEVGDMPRRTQSKLLRVLETGRVERVGSEQERLVDVRVISATNIPLEQAVGQGRFRADLYHRLSVLRIHLPPLRERSEDIPALVNHFLRMFNRRYGRRIERLTPEAQSLLQSYLWPGNVRELRNVLERVYVETQAEVIPARAFREWVRERQGFSPGGWDLEAASGPPPLAPPYPLASERPLLESSHAGVLDAELLPAGPSAARRSTRPVELEPGQIRRAYAQAGGNLSGAARLLGVHRATLYRYLQKLGLRREDLEG